MPVHVYVDVDGVLNAVTAGEPDWAWPDSHLSLVAGFPIRWSATMVLRLNRLAARGDTRMFWLTTWGANAAGVLSVALGVDGQAWPVLGDDERERAVDTLASAGATGWWKLDAIRAHLPSGTPAVWIDDDLDRWEPALDWVAERGDVLAVSPATSVALTPDALGAIEAYVDRVSP